MTPPPGIWLDFYDRLWNKKQGKLEVLRGAQLHMLKKNRLRNKGKALPTTYGILADKQQRFEGWGREAGDRASFADTMAAAMMKAGGGKVMVSVEVETVNEDGVVFDVTPVPSDGD